MPVALTAATPVPQASANQAIAVPAALFSGKRSRQILDAQVLLDRAGFSPGAIDGYGGSNTRRAVEAYQRATGIRVTGNVDTALLSALKQAHGAETLIRYRISEGDAAGPFRPVPGGMEAMAELEALTYERASEALAERFHMSEELLTALNEQADLTKAGTEILVVCGGKPELGVKVARIEVDKANSVVRAFASDGELLATYPATVGSSAFPSPSGRMTVRALAPSPKYYFSPEGRNWGPDQNLTIAAGPNNPVGSTWIDLSEEGYGIHGTPDPSLIGKTASHGCVRLTNWDAEELGKAVEPGTVVEFL